MFETGLAGILKPLVKIQKKLDAYLVTCAKQATSNTNTIVKLELDNVELTKEQLKTNKVLNNINNLLGD